MEILNINLAANATTQLRKAGSYIEILSATAAVNITLWTVQGGTTSSIKGGVSGIYLDADFGAFDIADASGAANNVQLLVCDAGESGGSRRQPGVVQVIDTDKATTESGMAFMGVNSTGAVAGGLFGSLLLWNPAGSGRKVILERVYADPAGATNIAAGIVSVTTGVDAGTVGSKLSNGANSLAHIFTYASNAADPAGLMPGRQVWAPSIAAGGEGVLTPKRPFLLLPGSGFMVAPRVANTQLTGTFEFWEQSLT